MPARIPPRPPEVEPLTADLRRLHLTVSKGFLEKVAQARTGLSHALPGATTEQVLEAALGLLLRTQASRKALVRRPRKAAATASPPARAEAAAGAVSSGRRPHIPATVERDVRLRDGDRCQHPLESGATCGSRWQVELDHILPLARGGATEPANLRCLCRRHHARATEEALGAVVAHEVRRRGG